jgi:hypothetical protein
LVGVRPQFVRQQLREGVSAEARLAFAVALVVQFADACTDNLVEDDGAVRSGHLVSPTRGTADAGRVSVLSATAGMGGVSPVVVR